MAVYQEELLSIPQDIRECPGIIDILPSDVHHYLEAYQEQMLKDVCEVEDLDIIEPYFDKKLFYNQKTYHRFVSKLNDAGLLNYTLAPKQSVAIFFVWKSGRKVIRLIIDARPANQMFKDPPGGEDGH